MKKLWILLAVAGLLLIWSFARERFEPTSSIKAPPYFEPEKRRIYTMISPASAKTLMDKAKQAAPAGRTETMLVPAAVDYILPAIESFYTRVYKPATTTLTPAAVDTFMADRTGEFKEIEAEAIKAYFINQSSAASSGYLEELAKLGQTYSYQTRSGSGSGSSGSGSGSGATGTSSGGGGTSGNGAGGAVTGTSTTTTTASSAASATGWEEGPQPVCPAGTSLRTIYSVVENGAVHDLETPMEKCYGARIEDYQCPDGYEPTRETGGGTLGKPCRRQGGTETVEAVCPAGLSYNDELAACESTGVDPTCPGGYQLREGKCMRQRQAPATTTGGSSTSMRGPTTGGPANRLRQVFGPQFTERGNDVSRDNGDSSQTNVYPELLGGMLDTSSRIPGVGVVPPSKNWTLTKDGSLPTRTSLGADEMSRYFPFSRTPGDMDIIPDPYRVAQTFSASSYSSKTEPAPFLTDFSAFLQ